MKFIILYCIKMHDAEIFKRKKSISNVFSDKFSAGFQKIKKKKKKKRGP